MIRYQLLNAQWQQVPVEPFLTMDDAKRYVRTLLETFPGPFYIVELRIKLEMR